MNPDSLRLVIYKARQFSNVNNKLIRNMRSSFIIAALATASAATQIVFKTGSEIVDGVRDSENFTKPRDFRPSPNDWKMQFRWPRTPGSGSSYRCTATMITPQVAITAAHCVRPDEEGFRTKDEDRLKVKVGGQKRTIKEIRVPGCWNYEFQGPLNVDIAMLILNKELDNAEEGVDYAPVWDPSEHNDEKVKARDEFTLAGYGSWKNFPTYKDEIYDFQLNSGPMFHKGQNIIESIQNNFYFYRLTNPRKEGSLKHEVATSFGDSGGGGLIERDGKFYTIGVVSHGYYRIAGFSRIIEWDFLGAYTRTDGAALPWIKANLAKLGKNGAQAAEDCVLW